VSDPHYHNYKPHSTLVNGVNSRLLDVDNAMAAAAKLGDEKKCDIAVVTGDIFHERGRIRPSVFNRAYNRIGKMRSEYPVVLGIGNHDMEDFKLGASSIDTFESLGSVYVMGGSEGYSTLNLRGIKILGIQYFHKTEDFKETYEKALKQFPDVDILMIHQGIDDFGHKGMPKTKITAKYLQSKTDAWIVCGHYHSPNTSGKVVNVGAPLQHTFGDEGIDRGCWIIDTDEDKATFYKLDVTPKFKTVRNKAEAKDVDCCFVRVVAKTPRTAKTLEKAAKAAGARTVAVQIDKDYKPAHSKTVAISSRPQNMIADFCKLEPKFAPHETQIINMYEKVCL
jgi:DNA repair exonuclease SbcCD nuclease subunit